MQTISGFEKVGGKKTSLLASLDPTPPQEEIRVLVLLQGEH